MTNDTYAQARIALITGGSRGLGRALTTELLRAGWRVVTDGRDPLALTRLLADAPNPKALIAVPGDVADSAHRNALLAAVVRSGGLDLLVNNASVLGPSPLPALAGYPIDALKKVYDVNLIAPLALTQLVLPHLERRTGRIINISSDAAVEPYEGWGGYGSSKAALDQLTDVLAAEHPGLRIYALDPGDMRTDMHARAFPGEDISDRPEPETVVPALTQLIDGDLPSGRYRATALLPQVTA
ncbi:MAG: SDR family oxidoreductase [Geodermatophilaceae bacterium]|jgi:NAD(P)-dependent dehydrogenase (short-subunit alcohol dehydrogenase family)|nr:SDR family oxidoreductase [Geodermatophilaceae bacterium]